MVEGVHCRYVGEQRQGQRHQDDYRDGMTLSWAMSWVREREKGASSSQKVQRSKESR